MTRRTMRVRVRVGVIVALICVSLLPFTPMIQVVQADAVSVAIQHNDLQRTGQNLRETVLTTTNVTQSAFGELFTRPLDGNMFAQPLYAPALTVKGTAHNVVFAATEHNSVYAYDADTSASDALWKTTLPDVPVPMPNMYCCGSQLQNAGQYQDIKVELGITSTPAIDLATNTIYVVSMGQTGSGCTAGNSNANCRYQYTIHALDLLTGIEKRNQLVQATYPGFANYQDPNNPGTIVFQADLQTQRPALMVYNNSLYIAFGSFKDDNPYHGWLMRYAKDTLQQGAVWCATPNSDNTAYSVGGGFWNVGQGPAVDPDSGDLFTTVGNGTYTISPGNTGSGHDISDSLIRFDKDTLVLKSYFTPFDVDTYGRPGACGNASGYNCYDLDFGSAGVLMLPNTHLVLGTGKVGRFFLLDRRVDLGGRSDVSLKSDPQIVLSAKVVRTQPNCLAPTTTDAYARYEEGCTGKVYGAPVYWNGSGGPFVYVWPRYDSLKQFRFLPDGNGGGTFATTADPTLPAAPDDNTPVITPYKERPYDNMQPNGEYTAAQGGGILSITANGTAAGTGILWAAVPIGGAPGLDRQRLEAFNASDVTQRLWDSGDTIGYHAKFQPPTISNGHVYLASFYTPKADASGDNVNRLHVYGLLNAATALTATGLPTTQMAGQAQTVTVTLKDKNGNPATAYRGTVQVTSSDPAATLPPAHTFTAADAGTFTFNLTLKTPGSQTVTVADTNAGGLGAMFTIAVNGISSISPASGYTTGGTHVTLTGYGFAANATVTFGGVAGVVTGSGGGGATLDVTTPPHAAGAVDVVVVANGVTLTARNGFTYLPPDPQPGQHVPASFTVTPVAPQPTPPHPAAPTVPRSTGTPVPQPARH